MRNHSIGVCTKDVLDTAKRRCWENGEISWRTKYHHLIENILFLVSVWYCRNLIESFSFWYSCNTINTPCETQCRLIIAYTLGTFVENARAIMKVSPTQAGKGFVDGACSTPIAAKLTVVHSFGFKGQIQRSIKINRSWGFLKHLTVCPLLCFNEISFSTFLHTLENADDWHW